MLSKLSKPNLYIPLLIILAVVIWFAVASRVTNDNLEENLARNSDFVIDPTFKPNCDLEENPLCRDQILALESLEKVLLLQNELLTYPIFSGDQFINEKEEIVKLKTDADNQYFDNFFSNANEKYTSALDVLTTIENKIVFDRKQLISNLNEIFQLKKYDQMNQPIEDLKSVTNYSSIIDEYLYKMNNGQKFDDYLVDAEILFKNNKFIEAINLINKALKIFPDDSLAQNKKNTYEKQYLVFRTNELVAEIKTILFKANKNKGMLSLGKEKIKNLKKLNPNYNVTNLEKDLREIELTIENEDFLYLANYYFKNEDFIKAEQNYLSAQKIKTLDESNSSKLSLIKNINMYLPLLRKYINGDYDLKKDSNLKNLKSLIDTTLSMESYSSEIKKLRIDALKIYEAINVLLNIKILSQDDYFIELETTKLGSFNEKTIKVRPGTYNLLIKRAGKSTVRKKVSFSIDSNDNTYKINCSANNCSFTEA